MLVNDISKTTQNILGEFPFKADILPGEFGLDNSGEHSEKIDQLYFFTNYIYIANLFDILNIKTMLKKQFTVKYDTV